MVVNVKITIEISDALLIEARRVAARERIAFRALVEQGLRHAIRERRSSTPFRLRKATFRGEGLNRELIDQGWNRIRELAYQRHGR